MNLTWICPHFNDLDTTQLYDLIRLRQEVFVVEQDCVYLDADNKDQMSWHPMGFLDGKVVACTRIVPKGISYTDEVSIGRVITAASVRRTGVGIELMNYSLEWTRKLFPNEPIRIGAQTYLVKFYERFGFKVSGEEYLEDGIPHVEMIIF